MNKNEFLSVLGAELERQQVGGISNVLEYYDEMICDRIEDGMSEEEAVASMGSIENIVNEVLIDRPMPTLVKEKVRKSREKARTSGHEWLWITLAVVGFPVWFPLLLALAIVAFALFLVFWILVGTVFVVLLALGLAALACLICAVTVVTGFIPWPTFLLSLGGALVLGSICVLLWKPLVAFVKAAGRFFAGIVRSVKRKFI